MKKMISFILVFTLAISVCSLCFADGEVFEINIPNSSLVIKMQVKESTSSVDSTVIVHITKNNTAQIMLHHKGDPITYIFNADSTKDMLEYVKEFPMLRGLLLFDGSTVGFSKMKSGKALGDEEQISADTVADEVIAFFK